MRTEILVLRHAEVHNPTDIVYGRLPRFRLSARGREQAEMAGRFLSTRPIAAIYASPLLRARQTATIVSRSLPGSKVSQSRYLIEVKTSYQGNPNSILKPGFSFYEPQINSEDESMFDVWWRMLGFLQNAVRRHAGESIVAISHGDPIAIMRLGLENREFTARNLHSTVYPARASITQIVAEAGKPTALSYFDIVGDGPT